MNGTESNLLVNRFRFKKRGNVELDTKSKAEEKERILEGGNDMKRMKKFLAVLLAAIMVMAMGTSVFAYTPTALTSGSYDTTNGTTLTITGVATNAHTFTAYQIFSGTLSGNEDSYVLSDIGWGDCVDGDTLLAYLTSSSNTAVAYNDGTNNITWYSLFKDCKSAADVAEVLTNYKDDSDLIKAFADLVATNDGSGNYTYLEYYTNKSSSTITSVTANDVTTYTYTISNLAVGYYLVIDETSSSTTVKDEVSDYFLQVLGNTQIATKAEYPTVDKVITDSNYSASTADDNSAAIGDKVYYTITVNVPDISDYTAGYVLNVNDKLATGLSYNEDLSFTISGIDSSDGTSSKTVASSSLTSGTGNDYVIDTSSGTYSFVLTFENLYNLYTDQGIDVSKTSTITVNYSATVGSGVSIGTDGNKNTVVLTYSNDPNGTGTGTSTPANTYTYITSLVLYKYTYSTDGQNITYTALENAEFDLYMVDSEGTYYQLKTGEFTQDDTKTLSEYVLNAGETAAVTYSKINTATLTTGTGGTVSISSLAEGTYVLVETKAPTGYNSLSGNITFTLSYVEDATAGTATWSMNIDTNASNAAAVLTSTTSSNDQNSPTITAGNFGMSIYNASGAKIPTTGGMGTTILYIIGAILVIGAAVILVTRRRMANK